MSSISTLFPCRRSNRILVSLYPLNIHDKLNLIESYRSNTLPPSSHIYQTDQISYLLEAKSTPKPIERVTPSTLNLYSRTYDETKRRDRKTQDGLPRNRLIKSAALNDNRDPSLNLDYFSNVTIPTPKYHEHNLRPISLTPKNKSMRIIPNPLSPYKNINYNRRRFPVEEIPQAITSITRRCIVKMSSRDYARATTYLKKSLDQERSLHALL